MQYWCSVEGLEAHWKVAGDSLLWKAEETEDLETDTQKQQKQEKHPRKKTGVLYKQAHFLLSLFIPHGL